MFIRFSIFLLVFILTFNIQPVATKSFNQDEPSIKIQQILVNVNVTVLDEKTRNFPTLEAENFELYCEKVKQNIDFFSTESSPIIMGVVFDISGSMESSKYQIARQALNEITSTQRINDKYFVVLFDKFIKIPLMNEDTKSIFTGNGNQLSSVVPIMPEKQSTSFYDGVMTAVKIIGPDKNSEVFNSLNENDKDLVNEPGTKRRKIIVVISDGQDNSSRSTEKEIMEALKEKEIIIYTITITDPERGTSFAQQGEQLMKDIARKSGGYNFIPDSPHKITESCSRIRKMISSCYTLGFYYSGEFDGRFKKIEIRLKPPPGSPKLSAKYREGFKAPLKDKIEKSAGDKDPADTKNKK